MQGFTGQLLTTGGIQLLHTIGFCGPQYVSPHGGQGPQGVGQQGAGKHGGGQGWVQHETILKVFKIYLKILNKTETVCAYDEMRVVHNGRSIYSSGKTNLILLKNLWSSF